MLSTSVGIATPLLAAEADPNAQTNEKAAFFAHCVGFIPLHNACSKNMTGMAQTLLTYASDVNHAGNYGVTPLHVAVSVNDNVTRFHCTYRDSKAAPLWSALIL